MLSNFMQMVGAVIREYYDGGECIAFRAHAPANRTVEELIAAIQRLLGITDDDQQTRVKRVSLRPVGQPPKRLVDIDAEYVQANLKNEMKIFMGEIDINFTIEFM